jgi:hypothetical protein
MLDMLQTVTSIVAVAVATFSLTRWKTEQARADRLDVECGRHVDRLAIAAHEIGKLKGNAEVSARIAKPGPSRRAKDQQAFAAMRAARSAQLRGEAPAE